MSEQIIPAHHKLDKGDFVWLTYLIFVLIEPFSRHSASLWISTLAGIALFIALYLTFLRFCHLRLRIACLAGMFCIGALTFPHNGGATCYMIYTAALIPFLTASVPAILAALLAASALLAFEGFLLHLNPYSWFSGILLIITIGGGNIVFAQKARADRKSRLQQEEIESLAALAERERIARDLHDVLGHTLSVIVLKTELASRLLQRELHSGGIPNASVLHTAHTELVEVERTARTALAEVREAIGGYRARGLRAEIDAARNTLASAGVSLHTEGDLTPASLPAAQETVLALALREAVTNIVRHAHASVCSLRLLTEDSHHRLLIHDNGQHPAPREGNGLRGMRERIEALGGQLSLNRDAGTLLTIDLPLRTSI